MCWAGVDTIGGGPGVVAGAGTHGPSSISAGGGEVARIILPSM